MRIHILTIFPDLFREFTEASLIGKARERGLLQFETINIRDFAEPPHYHVDDTPYGGGPGMLMRPEPLLAAIEASKAALPNAPVILLSASGRLFAQKNAQELTVLEELIFVCGRYEGIDQRVIDLAVDAEFSIGDFVIMGGEVACMAIIEAIVRLRPDVIGNQSSIEHESFCLQENGSPLLEGPQYTRPESFRGKSVPEVLLSGNHRLIDKWRKERAVERTQIMRPDLCGRKLP